MCDDLPEFLPVDKRFQTKAIHTGYKTGVKYDGSVVPPIVTSTTFHQPEPESLGNFLYGRINNPNRDLLEKTLTALEDSKFCVTFPSGMAAIAAVCSLLHEGEEILCIMDPYPGTFKYFNSLRNVAVNYVDLSIPEKLHKSVKPNTKIIWLEVMSNPLMKVFDLPAIVKHAKRINFNVLVVVDNSFLSPYFHRPLDFAADISVSSATKYVNGHSDVLMGMCATNCGKLYRSLIASQRVAGSIPSPFDCYMALRGLRTLSLRMQAHMSNGYKVAKFLESHSAVQKVIYPGLPSHPGHEIAKRLWSGCSGMISFYLRGNLRTSLKFTKNLKYFSTCLSFGGYESLVDIPAFSHKEMPVKGVKDNLIRMSVGLECVDDLIADINQALEKMNS